jgi:hypothetical protein
MFRVAYIYLDYPDKVGNMDLKFTTYNVFITVKHNNEINYPDYRMSLLNLCCLMFNV